MLEPTRDQKESLCQENARVKRKGSTLSGSEEEIGRRRRSPAKSLWPTNRSFGERRGNSDLGASFHDVNHYKRVLYS